MSIRRLKSRSALVLLLLLFLALPIVLSACSDDTCPEDTELINGSCVPIVNES